jgi:type II secretory pathway pseudopilin PulG
MNCRSAKRQKGFSLLEATIVVGIMLVLAGFAVIQSFGSREMYLANSALDTVVGQLRLARELAITQRRDVVITIVTNPGAGQLPHIDYQVKAPVGAKAEQDGPIVPALLPQNAAFTLTTGVPDTPMAFGNMSAIYIGNVSGGPVNMRFTSTGQFTDSTDVNPINGTIFLGITGQGLTNPSYARAVTIMGGTGRVRPYTYTGQHWND